MGRINYFVRHALHPVLFFVSIGLLYFQVLVWHHPWGGVLFILYLAIVSEWWRHTLQHVLGMKRKTWTASALASFAAVSVLGLSVSVVITWYRFTPVLLWSCFVASGIVAWLGCILTVKHGVVDAIEPELRAHLFSHPVFSKRLIIPILYLLLWFVGVGALLHSGSDSTLVTPWQTIKPYYLPLFFISTFILGVMIFSFYGTKVILFFLVLHGLLLHGYLPLSHAKPWGGDVWRHVSMERQLARGDVVRPVLFGPEAEWKDVGSVSLPVAFLQPHKYAYGHLWGTTLMVSQTMQLDLETVNKWLIPILWSLFFPFLLFQLGRQVFRSPRAALFFAWLSALPFPLQALGALSLPVSLGLLLFLFTLSLFLSWLTSHSVRQLVLTLFFAVLMLFGYPLYSILIWVFIILGAIVRYAGRYRAVASSILFVLAPFVLPGIELLSRVSHLSTSWYWLEQVKRMAGEWSGWYFASEIRPHDIVSGNIIFNHTPLSAFVSSPFVDWRWHIPVLLICLWIVIGYGLIKAWQSRRIQPKLYALLLSLLIGGYGIGWYVLAGDRLLIRRSDALIAITMLCMFVYGLQQMHDMARVQYKRIAVFMVLLFLSWSATTTYASGPDMRVVSKEEYAAAERIWEQEKNKETHCVLADTWPLLALEAISGGTIVGGGFPMDYQFGQPERVRLLDALRQTSSTDAVIVDEAKLITGAETCTIEK